MRDAATVGEAMRNVTVVVSAIQGLVGHGRVSPASVDRDGNAVLVDAAGRHGAEVVLLSVAGAAADASFELARMKHAAERRLSDSGCPATIIRPAAFVQTWVEILRASAGRGRRPRVLARGDNPIPWVDVHEVAAVVVRAVEDPGLRGRTLDLVGPEPLTLHQLAQSVMAALGWPDEPQRIPPAVVRMIAGTVGVARPQVRRLCLMALAMDQMSHPDDGATRLLFPGLASSGAGDVVAGMLSTGSR